MASYTSNLNLKKPAGTEDALISDINDNMDKIDTAVGTINSRKVAYALGNDTVANIQTAMVTLAGTMADGEIRKVRCNITAVSGIFRITAYIGELMRISSSRLCVDLRESMDANEAVIGNYKDGTWYWTELATKASTRCKTKTFTMNCNSPAMGGVGYCGEAQLSNTDIENATVVVPQFARKSGYNYPVLATYEGGSLRLYSPTSLESVSVGVVLFYF